MDICWEREYLLAFHFAVLLYAILIVCVPLPCGDWGRMWNSIASVPDHCLFIYYSGKRPRDKTSAHLIIEPVIIHTRDQHNSYSIIHTRDNSNYRVNTWSGNKVRRTYHLCTRKFAYSKCPKFQKAVRAISVPFQFY